MHINKLVYIDLIVCFPIFMLFFNDLKVQYKFRSWTYATNWLTKCSHLTFFDFIQQIPRSCPAQWLLSISVCISLDLIMCCLEWLCILHHYTMLTITHALFLSCRRTLHTDLHVSNGSLVWKIGFLFVEHNMQGIRISLSLFSIREHQKGNYHQ